MAGKSSTIPFVGGHDTTADKHLAGLSRLRTVINGRLDADGRIVSRPNYTALATTSYGSGAHVCYDLFELDGRLCSLGDRGSHGHPTDVFEFVETGGAAAWKPTSLTQVTEPPRLPRGTHLREVGRPPDQRDGVSGFDVDVCSGFVLLTYNDTGAPPTGYAYIMRAGSGQSILFREFDGSGGTAPRGQLQAIGLASRLWAIGTNSATTAVSGKRLDPATDEDWTGLTTLLSDAGGFGVIVAAKVGGADQFVLATCSVGLDIVVRRYDSAGTLIVPSGGQYSTIAGVNAGYIAVEADTAANQLTVATSDGSTGLVRVYSWNLSTGAAIGGVHTPAEVATEVCQQLSLARSSSTIVQLLATCSSVGTPDVMRVFNWDYSPGSGTFATGIPVMGVQLTAGAVYLSSQGTVVFGAATDDPETTPNMLLEQNNAASDRVGLVATKDLGFASPASSGGLPKIAVDSTQTPPRYYWAHGVESTDGASIPVVCELRLTDPGRRQVARVGRGAVISGACPAWYDGAQLVEGGFTQRPRIVSLTASAGAGELAPGATYNYRVHLSWFDVLGRLHRSAVSLPLPVTMGAAEDTVTAVIADVHTGRHNKGSAPLGSVVRVELYRTRAIVTQVEPSLTGSQNVDPPLASLNGLSIYIYTGFNGSGAQPQITFGAGDTTLTAILATINASAAGRYLASGVAGGVSIVALGTAGEDDFVQINGDLAALETLGFTDGQNANGTTTIELGDVFHQTAVEYTVVGGASGDRVTIVDLRDDAADAAGIASQAVLYTQLESPLSDHSPQPADRCWAGPERVELAGHPRRESWSTSQIVDSIRAPSWAAEGTPGFSGSLIESIEAVITQENSKIYLTRKGIWQVDGAGPGTNGKGAFRAARRIFADGGLVADGWRSVLECAVGTWFQLGSDKLYLIPPGGSPTWAGFAIRELLRTYPVISGACLTGNDQVAAFALQNTAATSGRIALYDLRKGAWFVDDTGDVPVALADYQGRLCYCNTSGTVKMADTVAGVGAFVPLTLETGHATVFGVAGNGDVPSIMFVGSLLGDCTLELQVDYDDGAGYVTCGTFALTGTVGRTVREEFNIAQEEVAGQFALKLLVTGNSGSAGLALSALEVYSDRDPGPALLGNTFRR